MKPFEEKFTISGEHAGLHLLLKAKDEKEEKTFLRSAAENGVKVYGLSDSLVAGVPGKATVLLGFGGLKEQEITEGLKLLEKAWL